MQKTFKICRANREKMIFFIKNQHFCATLRLNISRTKEITAKPKVLSYVGHFYKHLKQNLRKSLEHFFQKGKKKYF